MPFPTADLVARGGEMYSHIFENPARGIARDHFWSITVDFEPIHHAGRSLECAATIDWIRFGVRDWRQLTRRQLALPSEDDLMASSFYASEHEPVGVARLGLDYLGQDRFGVDLEQVVDLRAETGSDADAAVVVRAATQISYSGLVIVPHNLAALPASRGAALEVAGAFVELSAFHPPEEAGRRFNLRPRW